MSFKYLICDLDNTLYSDLSGMLKYIDSRIDTFIQQKLNLTAAAITELRHSYWCKYGTTLTGLLIHHQIEVNEYIQWAYDIKITDFLKPDPLLTNVLESIGLTKIVFSNSPLQYIQNVLQVLKINHCFSGIYDIGFCDYMGKPNLSSYYKVLNDLGVKGEECIFVDDSLVNLVAAAQMKIVPIHLNRDLNTSIQWQIKDIYDLYRIVPELVAGKISA